MCLDKILNSFDPQSVDELFLCSVTNDKNGKEASEETRKIQQDALVKIKQRKGNVGEDNRTTIDSDEF